MADDKKFTIFYSWQLWTKPEKGQNCNRNFIDDALKRAAKQVKRDSEIPIIITRDTEGEPGHPAIMETIMKRIDSCDMYVADVSYVMNHEGRYTPNPNVMLELGYALKRVTGSRLILIMNTAHGSPEDYALPFDFQHRRFPITYHLEPDADAETRKQERDVLVGTLKYAIKLVVEAGLVNPNETLVESLERFVRDRDKIAQDQLFKREIVRIYEKLHDQSSHNQQSQLAGSMDADAPERLLDYYVDFCEELLEAFAFVVRYGEADFISYLQEALQLWTSAGYNDLNVRFIPSALLIYTIGTVAFLHSRWDVLQEILLGKKIKHPLIRHMQNYIANIAIELITVTYRRGGHSDYILGAILKPIIKQILSEHFINDDKFEYAYVSFEMLLILQFIHVSLSENLHLVPPPRSENTIICEVLSNWGQEDRTVGLGFLTDGILDNSSERLRDILARYTESRKRLIIFGLGVNYLQCFDEGND